MVWWRAASRTRPKDSDNDFEEVEDEEDLPDDIGSVSSLDEEIWNEHRMPKVIMPYDTDTFYDAIVEDDD